MANSTFKSTTMITDAEGIVANFHEGTFPRQIASEQSPRALGVVAKDLGSAGAEHTFSLKFLNVAPGNVAAIRARLHNLHNPSSGRITAGTLVIDGEGSYPHCVFTSCKEADKYPVVKNVTPANPAGTAAFDLVFDCVFLQTRR